MNNSQTISKRVIAIKTYLVVNVPVAVIRGTYTLLPRRNASYIIASGFNSPAGMAR